MSTRTRASVGRVQKQGERVIDVAREEARSGAQRAGAAAEEARAGAQVRLKDAGYAVLGLGEATVAGVRSLGSSSSQLPQALRRAPARLGTTAGRVGSALAEGYSDLASRGRKVTGRTRRDPKVQQARRQTQAASSQAKGAATRVGSEAAGAAERGTSAAKSTAETGRSATKETADDVKSRARGATSQVKGAATSAGKAARAQGEAARSTAEKTGAEADTGTGPLEDRTVEQLSARAAELDIDGRSSMKKHQLIEAIRNAT